MQQDCRCHNAVVCGGCLSEGCWPAPPHPRTPCLRHLFNAVGMHCAGRGGALLFAPSKPERTCTLKPDQNKALTCKSWEEELCAAGGAFTTEHTPEAALPAPLPELESWVQPTRRKWVLACLVLLRCSVLRLARLHAGPGGEC